MRSAFPGWARRTLVFLAVTASGMLMAAPSCDVSIQFDAIDLLFDVGDDVESPS